MADGRETLAQARESMLRGEDLMLGLVVFAGALVLLCSAILGELIAGRRAAR